MHSLRDIPEPVDMVDVFRSCTRSAGDRRRRDRDRRQSRVDATGIRHDEAAATRRRPGFEVVMNRCPKIEFGRLGGELSWSGINSGIIRNRPPSRRSPDTAKERPAPSHNMTYGFGTRANPRRRDVPTR